MEMFHRIKYYAGAIVRRTPLLRKMWSGPAISHGKKGVKEAGHRKYVGGKWKEIGKHQFRFLTNNGLKKKNYLLDIACGSFRLGVHAIDYLKEGKYMGIEKEKDLIERGIKYEVGEDKFEKKDPEIVISDSFEFNKFKNSPDICIANSLFSHLPKDKILLCMKNLIKVIKKDGVFFATYFEAGNAKNNPKQQHDHKNFKYTKKEIEELGVKEGWKFEYIGDWGHPRGQVMVKYTPNLK
jgi:SAM-dependent methyltransferase